MADEELIFHTLNGLKTSYDSLKQTIRTRIDDMTFSSLSYLLMAEELHLTPDITPISSILVAQHHTPSPSTSTNIPSSSTSGILPTPSVSFQFPNPVLPSQQFLPTFVSPQYNGPRFNRNMNRFKGTQFAPQQFSKSYSGFPNYLGYPGNFNNSGFTTPPAGFPSTPASCQICGRDNHQASTCYYRQNLNYRPSSFGQMGRSFGQNFASHGQNFPPHSQNFPSHGQNFPLHGQTSLLLVHSSLLMLKLYLLHLIAWVTMGFLLSKLRVLVIML